MTDFLPTYILCNHLKEYFKSNKQDVVKNFYKINKNQLRVIFKAKNIPFPTKLQQQKFIKSKGF